MNETAEKAAKPTGRTTTVPVRTVKVFPPATQESPPGNGNNNDVASSSGLINTNRPPPLPAAVHPPAKLQDNQSGDQTAKRHVVRLDQQRLQELADDPRYPNQATSFDRGQTTNGQVPALQFPGSASAAQREALSVSRQPQQQQKKKRKSKSTCDPLYYDLPLTACCGSILLLFLRNGKCLQGTRCTPTCEVNFYCVGWEQDTLRI